ncbi:MAG: carbohydrate ABC transporter permease [Defluviitaleaceae bacterium]|nr:carbohydrate ABC transporter permease [Defluviitaleaceae bacterium]
MSHIKRTKSEILFEIFNYLFLTIVTLLALYPVLYVIFASISEPGALTRHSGLLLLPAGFSLESYGHVFRNPNIISGYRNTLFLMVVGVSWNVLMTSLGAYFLSRKEVMWKNVIMFYFVFTMFFSGGMIPFFLNLQRFNLTGTLWGLIFPFSVSVFNMIILRTGFQSNIPDELTDSAAMDGAGHLRILFRIVYPLSKALLAVMVLFYGVAMWNGWFWASVIIRDRSMLPLQVILREILLFSDAATVGAEAGVTDAEAIGRTIRFATIVVATAPIVAVYPFLQKHFVKGVMVGAIKG